MDSVGYHFTQSPIITLAVGQDLDQRFQVHQEVLIRSPFFAACLKDCASYIESHNRTIELPEDSPSAVAHFVDWLYTGKCPISHDFEDLQIQLGCADIFAFGDKTCTEAYCNDIMDNWRQKLLDMEGFVSPNLLARVYEHGLRGSQLAKFGLESAVYQASKHPANFQKVENCYRTDWFKLPELMKIS